MSVFAVFMSWQSFRGGAIVRSIEEDFTMSFLHSAIAQQSLPLRGSLFSKQFAHPLLTPSFDMGKRRSFSKRIATTIELWYRRERKLSSEEFYQTHVNAIFLGMYVEMILGVAAGIVSILAFGI
jgi:hypothetical protein